MSGSSTSRLFEPVVVGELDLAHRVVLAPLTRTRADVHFVPSELMVEYYTQRGSVAGTLLITEAVTIAPEAGGRPHVPGISSEEQIVAWKRVTDGVHQKGSFIFAQLRAYGRAGDPNFLKTQNPPYYLVSSSNVSLTGKQAPRPLTISEIHHYIELYTQAAVNAIKAGFDGVELHAANGYLIDQFTSSRSNTRTDEWGGESIENRTRFVLAIVDSVVRAIGEKRTAIRLSPWSNFLEMRMDDPKPTYTYLVAQLVERFPNLAYIHVVEPGIQGNSECKVTGEASNDFIRELWSPRPLISAGLYTRESGIRVADSKGDLIAYGRPFISNPDLPTRLLKDYPLTKPDPSTFYKYEDPNGYIDYPTYKQE
ncbi:NADH:flavin oxidoreductase/NADH oxidase [Irpex rosettiformis]|uniref:NADH:flavin oxidoreductase/NADH oxidase n=1 Tax=Irpex rosettiformis TaxID=378272 RepID=A0ACB8TYP5_9APHY|nr:NADH:flavin oxidoreductase/NADH oxidase [Irpex rosettiformis]